MARRFTRRRILLLGGLAAAALAGVAGWPWILEELRIREWDHADIDAEVRDSLARGDGRFRAWARYSMTVPGVRDARVTGDPEAVWKLVRRQGWLLLPGISCTSGFGRSHAAADRYAGRYNRRLLAALGIGIPSPLPGTGDPEDPGR